MQGDDRCALVFAGGGSHGAVQVGMLREIVAAGERVDFVVGASAGAINAAWFSRDPTLAGVEALAAMWRAVRRADIMPLTLRSLVQLARRADSVFDGRALRALFDRHLGDYGFADARKPLHIVATDALSGHEVILSTGKVADALMASTAIPGVFPGVRIGDRDLVDGGVANNTPISTAIHLGARRILVLPTGHACALSQRPRGAASSAMNALNLLVARQLVVDIQRYAGEAEIIVAPSLCPLGISSYDYSRCAELIDRATEQTRAWIGEGGLARCETAQSTHIHLH